MAYAVCTIRESFVAARTVHTLTSLPMPMHAQRSRNPSPRRCLSSPLNITGPSAPGQCRHTQLLSYCHDAGAHARGRAGWGVHGGGRSSSPPVLTPPKLDADGDVAVPLGSDALSPLARSPACHTPHAPVAVLLFMAVREGRGAPALPKALTTAAGRRATRDERRIAACGFASSGLTGLEWVPHVRMQYTCCVVLIR